MKYEDLKDLKLGDKVVVEVIGVNQNANDVALVEIKTGKAFNAYFTAEHILGVYHEPTKIKMTVEEKKEFDELKRVHESLYLAFDEMDSDEYPYLTYHLFGGSKSVNNKNQLEFARAWDKPSRIEVIKPKRYYVHLFPGKCGYLNKSKDDGNYAIGNKRDKRYWRTAFTKDEILQDTFEITDKALEEVEEDENDI